MGHCNKSGQTLFRTVWFSVKNPADLMERSDWIEMTFAMCRVFYGRTAQAEDAAKKIIAFVKSYGGQNDNGKKG